MPDHVLYEVVDGQGVLLHLQSKTYFMLNGVGTRLFEQLARSGSVDAAYAALQVEYDTDPSTLRGDVERFVAELAEHDLIVRD